MMYGLNTHAIAAPPTNRTAVVPAFCLPDTGFHNRPRVRGRANQPPLAYIAKPGELIYWYGGRDAVSLISLQNINVEPGIIEQQLTPADARYRFFIEDGNVYAQMLEGRDGEIETINIWIKHTDTKISSHTMIVQVQL